jgi:4'-phosphopantetheinyl transferase
MSDGLCEQERRADEQHRLIRVWRVELDRPAKEAAALRCVLAPDECARADRFLFARDRVRFTMARGRLRGVIGRILGVAADAIEFSYAPRGKPALRWPAGSGLEFNVSHSNGLALIATCWERPIGVDIEYQRVELDFEGIAGRFFTPEECSQILAFAEGERRRAFFTGWARKEAFLKARGDGLWLGLDQFAVSVDPRAPARLLRTLWDQDEVQRWTLHDLDVDPQFAAAVAVAGAVPGPITVEAL